MNVGPLRSAWSFSHVGPLPGHSRTAALEGVQHRRWPASSALSNTRAGTQPPGQRRTCRQARSPLCWRPSQHSCPALTQQTSSPSSQRIVDERDSSRASPAISIDKKELPLHSQRVSFLAPFPTVFHWLNRSNKLSQPFCLAEASCCRPATYRLCAFWLHCTRPRCCALYGQGCGLSRGWLFLGNTAQPGALFMMSVARAGGALFAALPGILTCAAVLRARHGCKWFCVSKSSCVRHILG